MTKKYLIFSFVLLSVTSLVYCNNHTYQKTLDSKKIKEIESFLSDAEQNNPDPRKIESYAKEISSFNENAIPLLKKFITKQNDDDLIYRIFTIEVIKNINTKMTQNENKKILQQIAKNDRIPYIRALGLGILIEKYLVGNKEMIPFLIGVLNDNKTAARFGSVSETACLFLERYTKNSYGFIGDDTSEEEKKKIIAQWQFWWNENKDYLYWSSEELKFKTRGERKRR